MIKQLMIPSLSLRFAGIFVSYFLQVSLAYAACLLLGRLLRSPQRRFVLWMVFLAGSGAYWLGLVWSEFGAAHPAHPALGLPRGTAGWLHPVLIPWNWGHGVLVAGQVLALSYLGAVVLLVALAAWRHLRLWLVLRRGIEPSAELLRLFWATSRDFRMSRSRLLVLPGLRSPATACWWRPRILLPEICESLGATPQLADVLFHELVHVERRDYLWSGVSDLICRLLFFHPAIWQARKRMRLEGELACDMAVVEARPAQRADYADSLAYFVRLRMLEEGVSVGVDFAASASTLGIRIRSILATPQPMPWWKLTSRTMAATAILMVTALLLPALRVLLDFARPEPAHAAAGHAPPLASVARHRSLGRRSASAIEPAASMQDSLTSLRTRSLPREIAANTEEAGADTHADREVPETDRVGWRDSGPSVRTVAGVVIATVRQIPIGKGPRGHDRDHDGDSR